MMKRLSPFSPALAPPSSHVWRRPVARYAALTLLITLLALAGCAEPENAEPEKVVAPERAGYSTMGGTIGNPDDPEGGEDEIAIEGASLLADDDASWDGWTIAAPEQAWTEAEVGKWISFDPLPNQAVSPAFAHGAREIRVRGLVYFPEAFPVLGHMEFITTRQLFGVATDNLLGTQGTAEWLDIELAQSAWRIVPRARTAAGEVTSGAEYLLPWAFRTGWNQIELTVRVRDGAANDELQFRSGDKVYSWSEIDLLAGSDPFRYLHLGRWQPGVGEETIAFRDLQVNDVTPDTDMATPPSGVDYAYGGRRITSGFWTGWMVRTHSGAVRFYDRGGYGAMRDHTQGVYWMGTGKEYAGGVTMKVRFHDDQLTQTGPGRHLIGISSRPLCFTKREYGLDTWTRIDFDRPRPGRIRACIFNIVNGVRINEGRWPVHTFDIPFASERWTDVDIRWQMSGNRLTVTLNGVSHTFTLLQGSEPLGIYLGLGNMDAMTGACDFDDIQITR